MVISPIIAFYLSNMSSGHSLNNPKWANEISLLSHMIFGSLLQSPVSSVTGNLLLSVIASVGDLCWDEHKWAPDWAAQSQLGTGWTCSPLSCLVTTLTTLWQPDPGRPPLTVWRVAWPECLMSARSQTCYTPGDSRLNWTSWAHNQNEMRSEVAHGNSKIITKSASLITWIVFVDK